MTAEQTNFLRDVAARLERAGMDYMIAGSYSCVIYSEPRMTNDVDIVVEATGEQLLHFADALQPPYYVSPQAIQAALAGRSMFNVIDTASGWKADIIIRKDRPFSVEEFSRRRPIEFEGQTLWVVSPEDAILSKLEWAQKSDSERQLRDAASIAAVQWDRLDFGYLRKWAADLGVAPALDTIIREVESLGL